MHWLNIGWSKISLPHSEECLLAPEIVAIITWKSRIHARALFHQLARHKVSLSLLYAKWRSMQRLIAVVITLVYRQNTRVSSEHSFIVRTLVYRQNTLQLHSALSVKHTITIIRWFKYDRDWFVCKQAALRSSCATLREWSHNLHPPSCSG